LNLSDAELLKVPIWFIETTNKEYKAELSNRFFRAGFKSVRTIKYSTSSEEWSFLSFELN
jgi:hypothetical protein